MQDNHESTVANYLSAGWCIRQDQTPAPPDAASLVPASFDTGTPVADLRALLLRHLPDAFYPSDIHPVILPDGSTGSMRVIALRRGVEGSLTLAGIHSDAANATRFILRVESDIGTDILSVPQPAAETVEEALPTILADDELFLRVLGFFPAVQADALGATGKRPPIAPP